MTGKRQFGSLRRLPSGRWQARYRTFAGNLAGAPRTFKTKGDAARWLSSVEADKARGIWLDPSAGRVALVEYATAWLQGKATIAPRTREIYQLQLRAHILPMITAEVPPLGLVPLGELTPDLVRAWYAALVTERSKSVAAKAYVRLRQVLNQAVNDDRIAKNPCRIEGGGVERHQEQRFISLDELYGLAGAMPDRYRALVLTAGLGGLRQGELFALRRADVDLLHASIALRKRLLLASGETIEDDPKSEAGRRKVALPQPLVEELDRHLAAYGAPGSSGFVFTSTNGVPLERGNFRSRVWIPATCRVGLDGLRFHDLRHAAGTLAARTGATTKEIMARLGHASPRAAMVYQHATEDRDRLIAERLAPIVTVRPKLFEAGGAELLAAGFPLLPTADHPHWTVVLAEPSPSQFARVRALFDGQRTTRHGPVGGDGTMTTVDIGDYDLTFDPNDVGPDLVVECWISQSRRADDPRFDPRPGDSVSVGDDEGPPLHARVTRRDGNRVWVQVQLTNLSDAVA